MEKRLQRQRSLSYLKSLAVYLFLFFNTLVLPMIAALWIEDTFGGTAAVCTAGFLFLSTWYGFGTNEKITAFLKNESSFRKKFLLVLFLIYSSAFAHAQDFLVHQERKFVIDYILNHSSRTPTDPRWVNKDFVMWVDRGSNVQSVSFDGDLCILQSFMLTDEQAKGFMTDLMAPAACGKSVKEGATIKIICPTTTVSFTKTGEDIVHVTIKAGT
jgi:hypothetical protein